MLCYAWNVLAITDDIKVGSDDYDDAYNLLARIFSFGVGRLIRSGFHRSYIEETEELSTIRGKINIQESINDLSIYNKKVVCTYDEYSTNDTFNQIIRYTINSLIKNSVISDITKKELIKESTFFVGIKPIPPTKQTLKKLVFNRNNIMYKLLINISTMLYNNTTVNEEDGNEVFKDFYRNEQMHKVFELFLLNFYTIHLDKRIYHVHAPKINWHIDENAAEIWGGLFDIEDNPGDRRTDIVIENKQLKLQLIFDAKYYKNTFVNAYMSSDDETIRTSHINQIRGYLLDSDFNGAKIGSLIYPMVNNELKNGMVRAIQGTPITIKTVNLCDDWKNIETDLLDFVKRLEMVHERSRT